MYSLSLYGPGWSVEVEREGVSGLNAPKTNELGLVENGSGNEAGAAPRRERNVSPAGEFSAPHNVASASQGKTRSVKPLSVGPIRSFSFSRHGQNRPTGPA
jgi:hypothetical protein